MQKIFILNILFEVNLLVPSRGLGNQLETGLKNLKTVTFSNTKIWTKILSSQKEKKMKMEKKIRMKATVKVQYV